jgi:hypothetical protein
MANLKSQIDPACLIDQQADASVWAAFFVNA